MKSELSWLCIIIAATSLFVFACKTNVRGDDLKVSETENNTRLYIRGDDNQLLDEYNMALQQMEYQKLMDQRFIDTVKKVKVEEKETNAIVKLSVKPVKVKEKPKYTEEDLYWLSHVIEGEGGSDFITDEHQQLIGCVVKNRVNNSSYPDTIKDVITQEGQYQSESGGKFKVKASKRAIKNAKLVLDGKVDCPDNVIYQAEFKQGSGVYKKIETIISTTFFCYE